jgi:phytol kinase
MISSTEIIANSMLLLICYLYIFAIIFLTLRMNDRFSQNQKRKFLHVMIGNFVFIIPLFTFSKFPLNFPFYVAAPFVILTLIASSPIKIKNRMSGLADITSVGHKFGLVLYAISYTILAFFFSAKPYVIIAGILPMAFGDAAASLVGQKWGHHKLGKLSKKSFEGTTAMFLVTLISVTLSLIAFSYLCPFQITTLLLASLGVAISATILEAITPKGLDNITVPLLSAILFLVLIGGI